MNTDSQSLETATHTYLCCITVLWAGDMYAAMTASFGTYNEIQMKKIILAGHSYNETLQSY